VLELAEMASYVFDQPKATGLKKRLSEDAEAYRDWLLFKQQYQQWIAYILQLILRCPPLLTRPPGFAWVLQDLEQILNRRRWELKLDRDFWRALRQVRGPKGRPRGRALDFFRYNLVAGFMHPPEQLKALTKSVRKTKAVKLAAFAEQQMLGRSPDRSVIWRSYKRIDQYLRMTVDRMQAESSPGLTQPEGSNRPSGRSSDQARTRTSKGKRG
jgi:hypothetical protein